MTSALFFEPLLECLQQFVESAKRFDQLFIFIGQMPEEFLAQPLLRNFGTNIEDRIDALEVAAEREIEAVEVLLIFDEAHPRQRVKIIER